VERRDFLKFGVTVRVGAAAAPKPPQLRGPNAAATITADDVAALRHRLQRLRKVDEVLGGADSYSLYAAEVNRSHELLQGSIARPAVRVQLVSLYAEQTQQAGWAALDAGWDGAAADLYRLSYAAAEDAGDHGTASNALALRAYQLASSGRPDIGLTRQSLISASRPDVYPRVRALVHDRAAWTFALVAVAVAVAVLEREVARPGRRHRVRHGGPGPRPSAAPATAGPDAPTTARRWSGPLVPAAGASQRRSPTSAETAGRAAHPRAPPRACASRPVARPTMHVPARQSPERSRRSQSRRCGSARPTCRRPGRPARRSGQGVARRSSPTRPLRPARQAWSPPRPRTPMGPDPRPAMRRTRAPPVQGPPLASALQEWWSWSLFADAAGRGHEVAQRGFHLGVATGFQAAVRVDPQPLARHDPRRGIQQAGDLGHVGHAG
jgi:hypothetical protein